MKKIISVISLMVIGYWLLVIPIQAQGATKLPVFNKAEQPIERQVNEGGITLSATDSAEPETATSSGIVSRITDKGPDLTEPKGEVQGRLGKLLLEQDLGETTVFNFIRQAMKSAVEKGVPANTLVLILLFPIVTAVIAASRHLIGIRGFGIFTPALVSVGLLATGISSGVLLLTVVLIVATIGRVVIKKLKLPYLPRTSLLMWWVSMGVLGLLLASPYLHLEVLGELSIFPVLVLVLLAETFIEVQSKQGMDQALEMTLETLILAVVGYFVMKLEVVQVFVLLNPELVVVGVAVFNWFLGKFAGLRLLEFIRFRTLLD